MSSVDFSALRLPGFRMQWFASLCMSLAFETEMIIYLWYIYTETQSAFYLSLLAALPYLGTLGAPLVGLMGDHLGHKKVVIFIRSACFALSSALTVSLWAGYLTPLLVIAVFCLAGLLRPIDMPMRSALLASLVPPEKILSAASLSRIAVDISRIIGAITGGGIVVWFGMQWASSLASMIYAMSAILTFLIPIKQMPIRSERRGKVDLLNPFKEVLAAVRMVTDTPPQMAAMLLAFLVNLLVYPFIVGLVPYIVSYHHLGGQAELSYMTASLATGCIAASLVLGALQGRLSLGRAMCAGAILWSFATFLLLFTKTIEVGIAVYALLGFLNGLCIMPMAALQMLNAPGEMRGRILGLRSFAVYGLFIGLMLASFLIEHAGFSATLITFASLSALGSIAIFLRWKSSF